MGKPKSVDEVRRRLRDLVHKHRKTYIKNNLSYHPSTCGLVGMGLYPDCSGCDPRHDMCKNKSKYDLYGGVDEIVAQFEADIKNPDKLLREYRDVALLLWVLGAFDSNQDTERHLDSALVSDPKPAATFEFKAAINIPETRGPVDRPSWLHPLLPNFMRKKS